MDHWIPPDAKGMSKWEVDFARDIIKQFSTTSTLVRTATGNDTRSEYATTYLEIGSRAGGSFWHFGTAMPVGSRLISVDMRTHKPHKIKGILKELDETCDQLRRLDYDVVTITGNSHDAEIVKRVIAAADPHVDVLLIDGDHTDVGVRQDVKNYLPLVRNGGLTIFHDCGWRNKKYDWSKPNAKTNMDTVNQVFREIAHDKQCVLVQELAGLGFVWM